VAAAFAGPGAAWMFAKTGSWTKVFWVMSVRDLVAEFMALLWLKPLSARTVKDPKHADSDWRCNYADKSTGCGAAST